MRKFILLSLMLNLLFSRVTAQQTTAPPAPTPTIPASLTPEMSASSVSAFYSSLATSVPQQPGSGPQAGDVGGSSSNGADNDAGASGHSGGGITLSQNGLIAIIVVIVLVCIFGIASSVLWYLAKKRSWEVRKKLRSSARRVATTLTPRRSTFPKDVHRTRGLTKIDETPNSPRSRSGERDVEKAMPNTRMKTFEMSDPRKKAKETTEPHKKAKWPASKLAR